MASPKAVIPGISATIVHPDTSQPFPSHFIAATALDEPEPHATITETYAVVSTSHSPFAIRMEVSNPYPKKMTISKLGFHISVDGKHVWDSYCARPEYRRNHGKWEEVIEGVKEGKGKGCKVKPFLFAEISTNEECPGLDKVKQIAKSLDKVGMIKIEVFRHRYGKKWGDVTGITSKGFMDKDGKEVPEKAVTGKEVKSHGTALAEKRAVARGPVWTQVPKIDDTPIVIFRFIYRSEAALKSMHLIPRTPSPSPSRSPSPSPRARTPDINELAEQYREEYREFLKSKGLLKECKKDTSKRIKREHGEGELSGIGGSEGSDSRKRRKGEKVEIDLTGDGDEELLIGKD